MMGANLSIMEKSQKLERDFIMKNLSKENKKDLENLKNHSKREIENSIEKVQRNLKFSKSSKKDDT